MFEGAKTYATILKIESEIEKLKKENKQKKVNHSHENVFDWVQVNQKGMEDIRHIKNAFYDLYCFVMDNVPDNKYRANGINLMEAAVMQLNKAISRSEKNGTQT